jgi:uncharacterized protein (TIGR02001 family)
MTSDVQQGMQMRNVKWVVASVALAVSGAASAGEWSSTITAISDYDFRGVSLSAKDPALQASVDWAADNGFYAGAWASNLDYGSEYDGNLELDLYAGYAGETGTGLGYDAGLVYYTYPGSSSSATQSKIEAYPEVYVGLSYGMFEVKQWVADYPGSSNDIGLYTEASVTFEPAENFSIGLHAGYSYGDYFKNVEYLDYSVSLGYTLGNFGLELKYVDNDISRNSPLYSNGNVFSTDGRVIFSVSTTLPW